MWKYTGRNMAFKSLVIIYVVSYFAKTDSFETDSNAPKILEDIFNSHSLDELLRNKRIVYQKKVKEIVDEEIPQGLGKDERKIYKEGFIIKSGDNSPSQFTGSGTADFVFPDESFRLPDFILSGEKPKTSVNTPENISRNQENKIDVKELSNGKLETENDAKNTSPDKWHHELSQNNEVDDRIIFDDNFSIEKWSQQFNNPDKTTIYPQTWFHQGRNINLSTSKGIHNWFIPSESKNIITSTSKPTESKKNLERWQYIYGPELITLSDSDPNILKAINNLINALSNQSSTSTETSYPAHIPNPCQKGCHKTVTNEYNPVCGSDGVTYSNPSKFLCAQRCGREIRNMRYASCGHRAPII